ncbi:collagen alpha-1(I) chain-like, partial [Vidua macroura]|uniref:collagen alpha-1(I) chain-like n=1 Tax=Vidua macroura TaxID=187451 RepID=UPI0023A8106B
ADQAATGRGRGGSRGNAAAGARSVPAGDGRGGVPAAAPSPAPVGRPSALPAGPPAGRGEGSGGCSGAAPHRPRLRTGGVCRGAARVSAGVMQPCVPPPPGCRAGGSCWEPPGVSGSAGPGECCWAPAGLGPAGAAERLLGAVSGRQHGPAATGRLLPMSCAHLGLARPQAAVETGRIKCS